MQKSELKVFREIAPHCNVVFDVGARTDIDYVLNSYGNGISYFLFEPNPKFYKELVVKVGLLQFLGLQENIFTENVAAGHLAGMVDYFETNQTLLPYSKPFDAKKIASGKLSQPITQIRLDDFSIQRGIRRVDFLKTDIEEYDYFALVGAGSLLRTCKFIQFELGIGAPLSDRYVNNQDYLDLIGPDFEFFLVRDDSILPWVTQKTNCDLLAIDATVFNNFLPALQKQGAALNILAVNKSAMYGVSKLLVAKMRAA